MIVRFFKSGTSRGEPPVKYVLGAKDHQGMPREEKPEVLSGIPELTIDLINGIKRKHKYSSGCLAFRPDEQPTRLELHKIIQKFKSTVAPGLNPNSIDCLFVMHHDKPDKKTGLAGFHVHFIIPMVRLDDKHIGHRWNPHPPGKETIELMSLFTSTTNHEMGWNQVQPNPLRVNIDSFWRKVEGKSATRKADLLKQELEVAVSTGKLKNKEQLCDFIANDLGLNITRNGADYLSVKFPFSQKAIRLKGPLFDNNTNYERLIASNSQQTRSVMLTDLEYQTHKQRFSQLLQKRGQLLADSPISINLEIKNGDKQHQSKQWQREQKTNGEPRDAGFAPSVNRIHLKESARGISARPLHGHKYQHADKNELHRRTDEQNSGISGHHVCTIRQNCGDHGGGKFSSSTRQSTKRTEPTEFNSSGATSEQSAGSNTSRSTQQYAGDSSKIQPTNTQSILFKSVNSAEEINDQLRKLGMALATASYEGQSAIYEQINQLIGRREKLPKPK